MYTNTIVKWSPHPDRQRNPPVEVGTRGNKLLHWKTEHGMGDVFDYDDSMRWGTSVTASGRDGPCPGVMYRRKWIIL